MFLNSIDSNLQFTIEVIENELRYLDSKLTLKVYSKPTNSHSYLQADSYHHLPSVLRIPKGVALRLRRICSTDEDYSNRLKEYNAYVTLM